MAGRLGHADPSVTLRVYSHALEERDRAAATIMGAAAAPTNNPRRSMEKSVMTSLPWRGLNAALSRNFSLFPAQREEFCDLSRSEERCGL